MTKLALVRGPHLNLWDIGNYYGLVDLGIELYLCGTGSNVPWDDIMTLYPRAKAKPYDNPWEVLELEPDVIDVPDAHYDFSQWFVDRHPRVVVVAWDNLPGKNTMRPAALKALQDCWKCVARSSQAASTLQYDGISRDKIKVIYGSVDTNFFRPLSNKREKSVLFVGRITLEKGLQDLLWAMRGIDAPLWIVGEGDREPFIKWGSGMRVTFFGQLDRHKLRDLYCNAQVFCVPSIPLLSHDPDAAWLEQFGQVFVEAMACGLPIVSTQSGAIPEVVGDDAVLVPPRAYVDLHYELADLISDPGICWKLGQKMRERAEDTFSPPVIAKQIKEWYEL